MRIKNGWWAESKSEGGGVCSANKFKAGALKVTLVAKTRDWLSRCESEKHNERLEELIDGPGVYVFKHREHQCFQFVGAAYNIFTSCSEKLKCAFDGSLTEPLGSLLVVSMASDWDFYFISTSQKDDPRILQILHNDIILKHDTIWPRGLNFTITLNSTFDLAEFRKSCVRHHWPPESDTANKSEINLDLLRQQILEADRIESSGMKIQINGISIENFENETHSKVTCCADKTLVRSICNTASSSPTVKRSATRNTPAQTIPKPPPSPRQMLEKRASSSLVDQTGMNFSGRRNVPLTNGRTKSTSTSKSPAPKNVSGIRRVNLSKSPNRNNSNYRDIMSLSLDAARSLSVFNSKNVDDMTSSRCVADLENAGVLTMTSDADDVMKNEDDVESHSMTSSSMVTSNDLFNGTTPDILQATSEMNLSALKVAQKPIQNVAQKTKTAVNSLARQRALSATDVRKKSIITTTASGNSKMPISREKANTGRLTTSRPSSAKVIKNK